MKPSQLVFILNLFFTFVFIFSSYNLANAQKIDGIERDRLKTMLKTIKNAVEDGYYDPNYHGIDLEARFKLAEDRMKNIETLAQGMGVIAQVLLDFNDSHLYFQAPLTNVDVEYGWRTRMSGDILYVTTVKPKSDAEAKGLKVGDQILMIENFKPVKREMWKVDYFYNVLSKRSNLTLQVISPDEKNPRTLNIKSKVEQRVNVIDKNTFYRLFEPSAEAEIDKHLVVKTGDLAIWKMPTFAFEPSDVETLMSKIKGSTSLILDLRGNGGGYVLTLERLVSHLFDKDLRIAELKGRKKMDPQESKTKGADSFKGKLVVLIDGRSGSAAEIFARLVQLENRGKVLGDVSAGAVMQALPFTASLSNDSIFYGASITNADVIMSDGKSLEHVGVTPDELLIPTGADLAAGRDTVLSKAAGLVGHKITPEAAGSFFRFKWRSDTLFLELNTK